MNNETPLPLPYFWGGVEFHWDWEDTS
jgi:hypothetical protein